jgi:uncharacterized membrane protein
MKAKEFLSRLAHDEIVAAIHKAEQKTSGEIRVFVTRHEPDDAVVAAQKHFAKLGMQKTKDRNGVLIYVAPRVRKFALIGDSGVHEKCGDGFWRDVAAEMSEHFKKEGFTEGIVHGVTKAGALLAEHFPRHAGDRNQLPDEVEED